MRYEYHSLEDFLTGTMAHVDGQLDDGWGASFPVKGREIDATVLFADISGFSARTADLTPAETLIFVNNFFAWITAEALRGRPGIVDKYIGDEVMVVFSNEFGSADPFLDAVRAARAMSEHDAHAFSPHMGIASGAVIVGYVGTPLKYSASVFGAPVALAARCAGIRPSADAGAASSSIVFPAREWGGREFSEVFPPRRYVNPDGSTIDQPHAWELQEPRKVPVKNLPPVEVREILNRGFHGPSLSAEDRAREALDELRRHNRYWPDQGL
jgi:class 3 adenylate cyclase